MSGSAAPAGLDSHQTAAYTALMANSQPLVAGEILDAHPMHKHRCLLDVGGGDGGFLLEAAKRCDHLKLMLFDLPAVAQRAGERFDALGLSFACTSVRRRFSQGRATRGADIVSLIRVVHDHNDDAAATLLHAAYRALPAQGVLLLAEPMMGTPGAETVGDAYFGFYLLAMGRGKPRSPQELQRMLLAAGFTGSHLLRTRQPLQTASSSRIRDRTP